MAKIIETHITYRESNVGYLQDAEWEEMKEMDDDDAERLVQARMGWQDDLHMVEWRYA